MQDRVNSSDTTRFYGNAQPPVKAVHGLSKPRPWKHRCVGVNWGMWNVRTFHSVVRVGEDGVLHRRNPRCSVKFSVRLTYLCVAFPNIAGEEKVR